MGRVLGGVRCPGAVLASAVLAALLVAGLALFEGLAVPAWGASQSKASLSTHLADWWNLQGQAYEHLRLDVERTASGPLEDGATWELTLYRGGQPGRGSREWTGAQLVAEPDAAMLERALGFISGTSGGGGTMVMSAHPHGSLTAEHEVVKDMLANGQTRRVEYDPVKRWLNIARPIAPSILVALTLHLVLVGAWGLWRWASGRTPRAMRGWRIAIAVSSVVLPGAALVLWIDRTKLSQPWWAYVIMPVAVWVVVLAISLIAMACKRRRAGRARFLLCPRCLYDLRDLPGEGACPECGRGYERDATIAMWRG